MLFLMYFISDISQENFNFCYPESSTDLYDEHDVKHHATPKGHRTNATRWSMSFDSA